MFKTALKLLSFVLGIVFICFMAYLVTLVRPGAPSRSASLQFVGYIPLPKMQTVSVLDYISVYGDQLYVAGMTSGTVMKVTLRSSALPTEADVSTMQGTPQTHGVVIDPASHLGFVTRS
jgi:hypothetical protein